MKILYSPKSGTDFFPKSGEKYSKGSERKLGVSESLRENEKNLMRTSGKKVFKQVRMQNFSRWEIFRIITILKFRFQNSLL